MLAPPPENDATTHSECRDCGLVQTVPAIADGEATYCGRCAALLRRAARDSVDFARVNAVTGALLFAAALTLPLVDLRVLGRTATSTPFSGPDMLRTRGLPALATVVVLTLFLAPAVKLAVELAVLFGAYLRRPPSWLPWVFGWLERISPWAMVEVFLLGSFVAYTRLQALAKVDVQPALWAFGGVMLSTVATDATLDREAVWQDLGTKVAHDGRDEPRAERIGCDTCRLFAPGREGAPCPRCGHRLHARKPNSLGRTWAFLLAGALLYVPANVLPVMTVQHLTKGETTTILHGVVELAHNHLWPLALLVLLASIVVPLLKLGSLSAMLVMTHRRSHAWLPGRTRLFRFVRSIGRWSMIDVFMLTILVGVVKLGSIATVLPNAGASAFCAVVVLTMLATESFDPRLMWDAGAPERRPPSPHAAPRPELEAS